MNRAKSLLCLLVFVLFALPRAALAGWFEVENYVGTIGDSPVHISLQSYKHLGHAHTHRLHLDGSYYYDSKRIPIPLQGTAQPNGSMTLCEARRPLSVANSATVPKASAAHPVPCQMSISVDGRNAVGVWWDGKNKLPITLKKVGSLDDTDQIRLEGDIEIPMWHHTKEHLLLGIYKASEECPVSMLELRLINKRTGETDKSIELDCMAGMIMTTIYTNISAGPKSGEIKVGFQGGKMGYDEIVNIALPANKITKTDTPK